MLLSGNRKAGSVDVAEKQKYLGSSQKRHCKRPKIWMKGPFHKAERGQTLDGCKNMEVDEREKMKVYRMKSIGR